MLFGPSCVSGVRRASKESELTGCGLLMTLPADAFGRTGSGFEPDRGRFHDVNGTEVCRYLDAGAPMLIERRGFPQRLGEALA
jgi:hypothetical protein